MRGWERFDPGRAPERIWLLAIARNLLIDHYRVDGSSRERAIEEVPERALPTVEPELAAALAGLAPCEREILALRFGGDLGGPEIATLTNLPREGEEDPLPLPATNARPA